jgi:hypothetical protein
MRWLFFIIAAAFLSCREILPVEGEEKTDGYLIKGIVTNQSGTPLENVDIKLYYETNWYSNSPTDTIVAVVTDTTKFVTVEVVSNKNVLVKKLFTAKLPFGPIPRPFWDGTDIIGRSVVPGLYTMRYLLDTLILKESPVIVDGTLTARTDADGLFLITNDNLPIGKIIDEYDNQNKYLRTVTISSSVILELFYGIASKVGRVELTKDVVTHVNVTM